MRILKIFLVVTVIAAISFFVIRSVITTDKVGEVKSTGNPFIDKIQQEISSLKLKPDNKFCREYYSEIAYHLEDYHKSNRLGKSPLENDQWKENLSKLLYGAYTDKFIKQAFYIFNRSDWAISDLSFIRNEFQALQRSPMLERNSPLDKRFTEIKMIFNKYDEITSFISSCQNFSFNQTDLDVSFPLDDIKKRMFVANSYRTNRLDNAYVNNCTRLHEGLKQTPQFLFWAHVRYLDNLIKTWSNNFSDYTSQKAYVSGIYSKLKEKNDELDSGIYNVTELSNEYSRLQSKLEEDGTNAYNYFNSK